MWFRDLAKAADGPGTVPTLAAGVAAGLATIQRLAGAEVGDSTMVDALAPAARALERGDGGRQRGRSGARGGRRRGAEGAGSTRDLLAGRGRASYVGEVARGVLDPGAVAVALFFAAGVATATGSEPGLAWLEAGPAPQAASEPDAAPPAVDEAALDDLGERLRRYRAVPLPRGHGWDRGVDAAYLADLVRHWAEAYDWRTHEEQVRSWPWVRSRGDGSRSGRSTSAAAARGARPLLLLHGWPDSVLRFAKVLPLLSDVDVVVPALPGFPFAARSTPRRPAGEMAAASPR